MTIRIDGTNTTANPGITGADADTGLQFGTDEVKIVTGGTDAITVDASQNVGIGTTSPGESLDVVGQIRTTNTTAGSGLVVKRSDSANASGALNFTGSDDIVDASIRMATDVADSLTFQTAGTERMRIGSNGYLYCLGVYNAPVGGTTKDVYVENNGNIGYLSSIKASKTNISNLDETDWLWSLSPKSFNYRIKDEHGNWTDEAHPELQYGLIAEEVEQVAPGICSYDVDEEGNKKLVAVQYSKLLTPLLTALQQANARIETLEAKVAVIETANAEQATTIASFEARISALEGGN